MTKRAVFKITATVLAVVTSVWCYFNYRKHVTLAKDATDNSDVSPMPTKPVVKTRPGLGSDPIIRSFFNRPVWFPNCEVLLYGCGNGEPSDGGADDADAENNNSPSSDDLPDAAVLEPDLDNKTLTYNGVVTVVCGGWGHCMAIPQRMSEDDKSDDSDTDSDNADASSDTDPTDSGTTDGILSDGSANDSGLNNDVEATPDPDLNPTD